MILNRFGFILNFTWNVIFCWPFDELKLVEQFYQTFRAISQQILNIPCTNLSIQYLSCVQVSSLPKWEFLWTLSTRWRGLRGKVKMLTICDCFQKVWQSLLYESNNCHCKSLFTFTLLPFEFAPRPNIKVAKIWQRQINLFKIQPGNKIQHGNKIQPGNKI